MHKPLPFAGALLAVLMTGIVTGCTLYPEKKPPTLANTTSAEQHDRILWELAQKQQWSKIAPLLATNILWNVDGKPLNGGQVVGYLQALNLKDAVIRDAQVQPNGPDMTVSYTLQIAAAGGAPIEFSAFSVWQQLKDGNYILIAHSQQSRTPNPATAAIR